jgi:CRISPR-associated protein Cas5/CasD subtype I-E
MEYIVLHLQGLLMSFGEGDHWDVRGTNGFPTKSFIVGMLAAGLGYGRDSTSQIQKISEGISMACREDKHPAILRDYQTILDTMCADGKKNDNAVISPRHYLADGAFTVLIGIKNQAIKNSIIQALIDPVWPPYLGRKSCIPSIPIFTGEFCVAEDDHKAFKKLKPLWNNNYAQAIFPCMGEEYNIGRESYVKDHILSLEPRIYKNRKVFYYTLSGNEIE